MSEESKAARTVRLAVPAEDVETLMWLANQTSPSTSMRMLVRRYFAEHGDADVPMALTEAPVAKRDGSVRIALRCADEPAAKAAAKGLFEQVGGTRAYAEQELICYHRGDEASLVVLVEGLGEDVVVTLDAGGGDDGEDG